MHGMLHSKVFSWIMFGFLLLIVNILGSGGLQTIITNNPFVNIDQGENTGTIISDTIEEEEGEVEEDNVVEKIPEETTLQYGSVNEDIGMKQQQQKQGKKKVDMVRQSSQGTTVPNFGDGIKDNFKQKLTDTSHKFSKDHGMETRDKRHRPRKETFTMEAERKNENCEAKTTGWNLSMERSCKLDLHDFIRSR